MLSAFAIFGLSAPLSIIVIIALLLILIFELAMLVSAILNQQISGNVKALWIVGMLLIHPFVAIGYYFTDYRKTK